MITQKCQRKKSCLSEIMPGKETKLYTILTNICSLGTCTFQNSKLNSVSLGSHSARYEISTEYICILIYDRHPNRLVCAHLCL